jgi:pimeloyl-ACP methyl ester esterase
MPFLTRDGVSLRYDRAGAGPAVLLIHGWTCNRTFWERQVQAFRDRHTVVTVDLRGHGESSRPRTGYTIPAMAADLEHLVRALNVPRIAVVGWSMGGMVAQELAFRLGDRLSALALVCTTPGALTEPKNPSGVDPEALKAMQRQVAEDARTFCRDLAVRCFKLGAASPLAAWAAGQTQKTPPHVVSAALEAISGFDSRKRLKDVHAPTAILHGRHDTLLPLSGGESLHKAIKGSTLTIFDDSAHAPFLEEPDKFNQALSALLSPAKK